MLLLIIIISLSFNYIFSKGCLWLFERSCVLSPNDISSIVDLINSFGSIVIHIL